MNVPAYNNTRSYRCDDDDDSRTQILINSTYSTRNNEIKVGNSSNKSITVPTTESYNIRFRQVARTTIAVMAL